MTLNGSSLLLIFASIYLAPLILIASTTAISKRDLRQDPRNLPSPLPASSTRLRQAGEMNLVDLVAPKKRAVGHTEAALNTTRSSQQKKRFKTSGRFGQQTSTLMATTSSNGESANATRGRGDLWRANQGHDANNNSVTSDDNNNNNNNNNNDNNNNNNEVAPTNWRRNVDSINGTIDLSQYERNDIDRLYGDALLVYFKNFNETLPARRELFSINGTLTSAPAGSRNRIPIYRSVSSDEPK